MMSRTRHYRDLIAWQKAMEPARTIYACNASEALLDLGRSVAKLMNGLLSVLESDEAQRQPAN
jgi:hypothetical protein